MRAHSLSFLSSAVLTILVAACGGDDTSNPLGAADASRDTGGQSDAAIGSDSGVTGDATSSADSGAPDASTAHDASADANVPAQGLVTTVDNGVVPIAVTINQGTAIGQGSGNGATPSMLSNVRADS